MPSVVPRFVTPGPNLLSAVSGRWVETVSVSWHPGGSMKKPIVVGGLAAAAALVAGGGIAAAAANSGNPDPVSEQNAEAAYTDAHRADAAVTQSEAVATATDAHPGTVIDAHLESEGQGLRWEIKPDDGTTVWEVQIDAQTGKVVSDHPDDTN